MEDSKVFKYIWRFNALVIAVAGLLSILVLLIGSYTIFKELTGYRNRNEVVNIDPESNIDESFRLGRIESVTGSDSVVIPLYSDQDFSIRYSGSKSTVSTRNLLFSNLQTENNHWLLPTNEYLIIGHRYINDENTWNEKLDVVTILYEVVKSDTNKDERLTERDKLTLSMSTPNGDKYTEVITNIDDVLGYEVLNKEAVAVVFNRDGQGYTAYVRLSDFSVTKEMALPKIGEKL